AHTDPEACAKGPARCIAIPRSVGVNPYLAMKVNGREATVPIGATLRNLVIAARAKPEDVLKTLRLEKPFAGKMTQVQFDHTNPAVLDLVLLGNEIVSW